MLFEVNVPRYCALDSLGFQRWGFDFTVVFLFGYDRLRYCVFTCLDPSHNRESSFRLLFASTFIAIVTVRFELFLMLLL